MRSRRASGQPASRAGLRCAIYTRKSSEERLEQEFNSLDAQREACEAYIRSQRHEGWTLLPTRYDDGGLSGGTMNRPALQRLLADVASGQVDLVVVYKVDRLTRSLSDFAKIVEVLDAQAASFVSITQQFNTTTSMGRLTLSMLLSFAQFEREVTGERIRDKIAASRRKGMWMGGSVPLGYEVRDRKLVVHGAEANLVRRIYRAYLDRGTVRLVQEWLASEAITGRSGRALGRGALFDLLRNRVYRGEVAHRGNVYPGERAAIIGAELWEAAQQRLAEGRTNRKQGGGASHPSPLAGMLTDPAGEAMVATHARKAGRRYRYYVSHRLITGTRDDHADALRVPGPRWSGSSSRGSPASSPMGRSCSMRCGPQRCFRRKVRISAGSFCSPVPDQPLAAAGPRHATRDLVRLWGPGCGAAARDHDPSRTAPAGLAA
ncbi:recombinase family protein [Siccirubricoccus sp. KC 17139]|uniref:Recombinase family protein n=1 Tax=Siccirubricoccus soli TaxID=2899147 RepID=A0ABT1DD34_9PROT|nr:recombinase family protein [Siccirubricoccus soli]MCO6419844.1 recombinase family protein [Siccirubricoccus soli]MCP2685979.1 recombinase family protein [Siccirubricoccus soli]